MKKIVLILAVALLQAGIFSCTPQQLTDTLEPQACCGDGGDIPPPPPPPPPGGGNG